jgi:hypothetical protein
MNHDIKKLAASMVAQQIAAYDTDINNLGEQIKQLEALREAKAMMRKALLPLAEGASSPLDAASDTPKDLFTASPLNGTPAPIGTSTGFSEAVRDALKDQSKGVKPSDVADLMRSRGTDGLYSGKTPFSVRVGNELHRLMKAGKVTRRAGRYYLAQGGSDHH